MDDLNSDQVIDRCQKILGYQFKDQSILEQALTHASGASSRLISNERLEFFGDAILGFMVCEQLYKQFPNYLEGDLTEIKSMVVSGEICAQISRSLGLDELMFLGKGMTDRQHLPASVAGAVLEALIAAVYLDGGIDAAGKLVLKLIQPIIEQTAGSENHQNYKSQLQQHAQQQLNTTLVYELLDEQGPDHSKCFEVCAVMLGRRFKSAWGPSKKEAEQKAARHALVELDLLQEER